MRGVPQPLFKISVLIIIRNRQIVWICLFFVIKRMYSKICI